MRDASILILLSFLLIAKSQGQILEVRIPRHQNFTPVFGNSASTPQSFGSPNKSGSLNKLPKSVVEATIAQKRQEVEQLIRDSGGKTQHRDVQHTNISDSTANAIAIHNFPEALKRLHYMLLGKMPLSIADAYYTIENAYGNAYLTREQYNHILKESVEFIKTWMVQNGLDANDNYMKQYAIQKFMSERLTVSTTLFKPDGQKNVVVSTHEPFHYDYNDYQCEKDYRNSFLTKCLATGFGQCSSMPIVYLALAEGLGVKAYLTFAPHHSFIKFLDNSGNIRNYEPTSNWEISDAWYEENMFISPKAVASGIYLDTLNSKQVVANCIFELALEFMRIDRSLNDAFIVNCLSLGITYFPQNNNLQSLFIYSIHLKTMLREAMQHYGIANIDDIGQSPQASQLYMEYVKNEAYITTLGYQDMPAGMYETMLKQHEFKGDIQKIYNVSGKEQRNLFSKTE